MTPHQILARSACALAVLAGTLALAHRLPAESADEWPADAAAPEHLAQTGLYADFEAKLVAPDVHPYTPQYPLWTDGAAKRRWIRLPPGSAIDASDPDDWRFPAGTRLWKEFSFGRRVETRYLEKRADGTWLRAAYVWSADERDAVRARATGVRAAAESAPGVPHDVPGLADCATCHIRGDGVLGFSALQLSPARDPHALHAEEPGPADLDLSALVERGWLRGLAPELDPRLASEPPRLAARTPRERAVLGYLHANCGSCHAEGGPLAPLELHLDARFAPGASSASTTPPRATVAPERVLETLVNRPSRYRPTDAPQVDLRVDPGHPERSALLARLATRRPSAQMPPLGTHAVDTEALALVEAWIREDLSDPPHSLLTDSNRGH